MGKRVWTKEGKKDAQKLIGSLPQSFKNGNCKECLNKQETAVKKFCRNLVLDFVHLYIAKASVINITLQNQLH